MSKLISVTALLFGLFITPLAQAEETIPDASYFVGTWKLLTARPKLNIDTQAGDKKLENTPFSYLSEGSKKQFNEIWKFMPNGKFELTANDHRASSTITTATTYLVENDTLKIAKVGRPGKFFLYKVYERDGDKMILKGGMEGYYFFQKQ